VTLYLINRKQYRLAKELGIVQTYPKVLKLPVAPAALERMRGATKVCPACAKEIRAESRFCGSCGHPFADEEIAASEAAAAHSLKLAKAGEAEQRLKDAAALRQKTIYDGIAKAKESAHSLFIGSVLFGVLAAGMVVGAIFGPDPQYLAIFVVTMVLLAGAAVCFWGVKRKRASAEKIGQAFVEIARSEGNLIFCPCGTPRAKLRRGLRLKQCCNCGAPYPAMFL
jgi:ABC-type Na+ efflux pump permease subunit